MKVKITIIAEDSFDRSRNEIQEQFKDLLYDYEYDECKINVEILKENK